MAEEWLTTIQTYLGQFPIVIQFLGWLILIIGGLLIVFLLFSVILGPLMWLYNRVTDKNSSNVIDQSDFLIGELTEKIEGASMGEVMEIGSQSARSVYPAKLYREEDRNKKILLPVGTKVIIVEIDHKGIALVIESKHFIE
ncbi:hypothetical protein A5886_002014 [Enterococcus sp. 8G7_MSG3316]|uniref:NfeD-like C-terminal domain-containing protein n=1 Tax=Candidatus Enterococcus testudinis TaxID=1834191 RepID=A0A242A7C1_9ENTE|nr:hypothetical protein [Enterococcus sp. 8G7_MSG3316]OTN76935.1 hypothetical protein A5886_002014 [Enterococcus sp. 8G7_MSG3316]